MIPLIKQICGVKAEKVPRFEAKLPIPHEKQVGFIESAAKRKMIKAGRRGGKTVGAAIMAVRQFMAGKRILYAVPVSDQLHRFWVTVTRALAKPIEQGILYKNETEHLIEITGTEHRIKGKAQPLTAFIYTPDGRKRMGDIQLGDAVLTPFGTVTKVTGIYPQGKQDIYEITFGDGCKTECTIDHLWEVQRFKDSQANRNRFMLVTTGDLLNHPKVNNDKNQSCRPRVRLTEPVVFTPKDIPLSPYLVGALIGDAKLELNGSPIFSTADDFILRQVVSLLPTGVRAKHIPGTYDYRLALKDKPYRGKSILRGGLRHLGLLGKRSHEKFIPEIYKYNSREVRISLLQGLFDTDGTVTNGQVQFQTSSVMLAQDVAEIVQSLGGLCTTNKRQGRYKKNGEYHETKVGYRQEIFYPDAASLFSLPRKKERCRIRTLKYANVNRSVRKIRYVRNDETQCIKVADERQLYLTDHFIVTHNTAFNADTLRGDYADLLILDEWQLMDEEAWERVGSPMLLDNDGDAVFIYTPPSLQSRSASKARDPQHASKMFAKVQADTTGRWETFHFTSHDNPHISKDALEEITQDMGSVSYRMEILAEDVDEAPGAMWKREDIDKNRVLFAPDLSRVVVGVDPSATSTGDEAGIIVGGVADGHGYVLADESLQGSPLAWATAAVTAYHKFKAGRIVAESNQGGEMVALTIAQVDPKVPVSLVHSYRGKSVRAEPVAARYEKGLVHHVGKFDALEDELALWIPGDKSPNRLDALVFAMTDLLLSSKTPSPGHVSLGITVGPHDMVEEKPEEKRAAISIPEEYQWIKKY